MTRGKVFCYYCRKASSSLKKLNVPLLLLLLAEDGFDNWKNALQKFCEYEGSFLHRQALLSHQTSLKGSVASLLSASLRKAQAEQRTMLMKQNSQKGDYRSHEIVNELVELMYMQLLRKLLAEVRAAEWYSIIADETRVYWDAVFYHTM